MMKPLSLQIIFICTVLPSLATPAIAGKCPALNGTYEKLQDYGMSSISIHTRRGAKGTEVSRDNRTFYPANGSKHIEKDEQFGDSEISFECRKGSIVIHQNLVKLGVLMHYDKALPPKGVAGSMTLKPAGKNAVMVEIFGKNPVLNLITGGKFTKK